VQFPAGARLADVQLHRVLDVDEETFLERCALVRALVFEDQELVSLFLRL